MPLNFHFSNCIDFRTDPKTVRSPHASQTLRLLRPGRGLALAGLTLLIPSGFAAAPSVALARAESSPYIATSRSDSLSEYLWWVMFLMGCDPNDILKGGSSIAAGMTVIELQYSLFGIPRDLNADDRATLMQSIQALYCSLSTNPPPEIAMLARLTFLSTLRSMWNDLGGLPGDLGC